MFNKLNTEDTLKVTQNILHFYFYIVFCTIITSVKREKTISLGSFFSDIKASFHNQNPSFGLIVTQ